MCSRKMLRKGKHDERDNENSRYDGAEEGGDPAEADSGAKGG